MPKLDWAILVAVVLQAPVADVPAWEGPAWGAPAWEVPVACSRMVAVALLHRRWHRFPVKAVVRPLTKEETVVLVHRRCRRSTSTVV